MALAAGFKPAELSLLEKLRLLNWPFVLVVALVALVGYGMLYSAGGGSHAPWAWRHGARFGVSLGVLVAVALIDVRFWFRCAYFVYGAALLGLVAVELVGQISMGAQRWLDLGIFQLQPSEVMKIALILALARYFHSAYLEDVARPLHLITPALMALVPATLVLKQPDLGTATMLLAGGGAMFLLAGVRWWKFALVLGTVLITLPIAWQQLHDYQKQRVMTFLDAEQDPLGTGYHIIQSKIALGSGGLWGKGFLKGTQSQLSFLPEKQTDFVFTMLAEEAGLIGALALLFLFLVLIGYGLLFALRARSHFARLLAAGITATVCLYVVINVAMVTGLIPVVGVPLPLISYGGTAMVTVLVGFGLILGVDIHRDVAIPRFPADAD
jgi:rod shape determining protein RodA